jgi:hypothetical protein
MAMQGIFMRVESLRVSFPAPWCVSGFELFCSFIRSRDFVAAALSPTSRQTHQSLLRWRFYSLILIAIFALVASSTAAACSSNKITLTRSLHPSQTTKSLLRAYVHYVNIIQYKGALQLSSLIIPSFEVRSGGHYWRGRAALLQLNRYDQNLSNFSVILTHLHIEIPRATTIAQEHLTFNVRRQNQQSSATAIVYWKEQWRLVAGKWRIASFSHVPTVLRNNTSGTLYTIVPR